MKCNKCKSANTKLVTKSWGNDKFIFVVCEDCGEVRKYESQRIKRNVTVYNCWYVFNMGSNGIDAKCVRIHKRRIGVAIMDHKNKIDITIEGKIYDKEDASYLFKFNPYKDYVDTFKGKNIDDMSIREIRSMQFSELSKRAMESLRDECN